jgi:hypothetical protein
MSSGKMLGLSLASLLIVGLVHAAPDAPRAAPVVDGRLSVRFENTSLEAAVEQLAAGIGARVEWRGEPGDDTVSADLVDVSIAEALERVLSPRSYFVVTAGGTGAIRRIVIMLGQLDARRPLPRADGAAMAPEVPGTISEADGVDVAVLTRLDDPDPVVRRSVLDYVRAIGPENAHREMILARLASDPDRRLREEVLRFRRDVVPGRERALDGRKAVLPR